MVRQDNQSKEHIMRASPRILIIDDDPSACRILKLIFGRHGYEIETAGSGQAAIERARAGRFNLALLDLRLPDTDGVALLAPLQEIQPEMALIIITGHASTETAVQAMNSGASAYITKPLNIEDVLAKVKDVLEKQRLFNEKHRAEDALRRRNRELALLNRVITAATSTLDVDHVLQVACEALAQAFDLPQACAVLLNADRTEGTCVAEHHARGSVRRLGQTTAVSANPAVGYLLQNGNSLAVTDAQTDERLVDARPSLTKSGTRSLLVVPIPVARGRMAGAIELHATERRAFSDVEITLAQNVAAAAGQALETARLYQALQSNVEKLEEKVARRTAELRDALERARDADRIKSEFVSNVSHELRTPLASLKLFLGLLTRGLPEKRDEYLATLRRETDRLQDLIEALLDISRLDLGKTRVNLQPTDLNLVVGTLAADRGALAADRSLILDVELAEDLPPALADPKLIEQVLTNLLTNAVNYTPSGGQISLSTGLASENGRKWVTTSVSDTGPGIPESERDHLFERFYRGSAGRASDAPGTGLGLAICKEIMALHGGRVTLESPLLQNQAGFGSTGPGSTFVIRLPVAGSRSNNAERKSDG